MKSVPRNVILDLLPGYLAGEASAESRDLVEQFARDDEEIAGLIRAGALAPDVISPRTPVPEDLEMKAMKRMRRSVRRQMLYASLATLGLLSVPLVAMAFSDEVDWGVLDFLVAGGLLFGAGAGFILLSRLRDGATYRFAVGVAVGAGLLLTWINLAVGVIGSAGHPANLLYGGVLAVGLVGAGLARFEPRGMSQAMFATALAQMLVPAIALVVWRPVLAEGPGLGGALVLNGFFAGLFALSGFLLRRVDQRDRSA